MFGRFNSKHWATGRPENKAVTGHRTPKVEQSRPAQADAYRELSSSLAHNDK